MKAIVGILAVMFAILWIEVPPLWKKKQKKELGFFSVLLLLGVGLVVANCLHIKILNPLEGLNYVFKGLAIFPLE